MKNGNVRASLVDKSVKTIHLSLPFCINMTWDNNSVGKKTGYGLDDQDSVPGSGRDSSVCHHIHIWGPLGTWVSFPRV